MTAIKRDFGQGGANLAPGGAAGEPDLATTLREIADDLDGLQPGALAVATVGAALVAPVALTVGADLPAFTDPPSAAEMGALRTFVNALKADVSAIRTKQDTVIARVNQVIVDLADARTKAAVPAAHTLLTTKG